MNCEYFNDINNLLPRTDDLLSIKKKNSLQSDIKVSIYRNHLSL